MIEQKIIVVDTNFRFVYLGNLSLCPQLRRQEQGDRENYMLEMEDVKKRCDFKQNTVEEERAKFVDFKKQIALNAVNSRSGKFIPPKVCVAGAKRLVHFKEDAVEKR